MTAAGAQGPRKLRLFFALWPSGRHRAALAEAAAAAVARANGQPVPPGNLHVTLAFLGMVPGVLLAQVIEAGGQAPSPSVSLHFRRIEYWGRPKVLVALPDAVPAAGAMVVDHLWRALGPLGFKREHRPWQPHLTIARRVPQPPPGDFVLPPVPDDGTEPAWRLALVESSSHPDGVRYKPIADWPLEGV